MYDESSSGWDFLGNLVNGGFAYLAAKETAKQQPVVAAVDLPQNVGAVPYPIQGLPPAPPAVPAQPGAGLAGSLSAVPVWAWTLGGLLVGLVVVRALR